MNQFVNVVGVAAILASVSIALSAQTPPSSDPQALSLVAQTIAALSGGNQVSDATLSASAISGTGTNTQTGTATLYAKGTSESRIDYALSNGHSSEIRNDTAGYPQGQTINADGSLRTWATHNCWITDGWFFPPLSFLASTSDSTLIFLYIGPETRNGVSVQHIHLYRYLTGQQQPTIALTQQVSSADYYIDSTSFLPLTLLFNSHPDSDASTNIAVEVDYSNYQNVNGVSVPFHVQQFIDGGIALDATVTSAIFNSGLSDSLFTIQ